MAKKYKKSGQADIYREIKSSSCNPTIGEAILLFIVLALISQYAEASTPGTSDINSHLIPLAGHANVLRYEKGNGEFSAMRLAGEKSTTGDRFVILCATTPEHEAQALAHAQKIAAWLEENMESVKEIPVIIYPNEKGVGYTFYISGLPYWHDEYAANGIMTPQQTVGALKDATLTYKARKIMRERGEYGHLLN